MNKDDYFSNINIVTVRILAQVLPLILWVYIWYNWGALSDFDKSLKEQKQRLTKGYIASKMGIKIGKYWGNFNYYLLIFRRLIFIIALLLPFIYTIVNFMPLYSESKADGNTKSIVNSMGFCVDPCFKKITSKKLNDIGIMGIYDNKCGHSSNSCVGTTLQSLIISSNIISLCIFLLVLLIYRNIPSAWDKRKSLNHWVIISLLIGFIIQHTTIWTGINAWLTYWVGFSASILLSMNISAFIIIISLLSTQVFFEFF